MIDPKDLHAYVDGELPRDQAESVRSEVAGSTEDSRELEAIRKLKALLAANAVTPIVDQSWAKCVRRLDELDKSRRIETLVSRFAPGLCCGLFVMILLGGQLMRHSGQSSVSGPDLNRMDDSFSPISPKGSDTYKSWLKNLIRQSNLSTPDHLTYRGVFASEIEGYPATKFLARDPQGDLNIIVIPQRLSFDEMPTLAGHTDISVGNLNGINFIAYDQGQNSIMIVADRSFTDLAAVAAKVVVQ